MAAPAFLAVARCAKPHGLHGDVTVFVLTDEPERVLTVGRLLTPMDPEGRAIGQGRRIERTRPYHRRWLLKFEGESSRADVAPWTGHLLGVPAEELTPPRDGEMYEHEVPGARVLAEGREVGTAREVVTVPGGRLLVVACGGREVLVPFRAPILVRLDRARREIEIDPPPGLLEL